jgi:hypothetical protein
MSKPVTRKSAARKSATTSASAKVAKPATRARAIAKPEKKVKREKKLAPPAAIEHGKNRIKLVRDSFTMPRDEFEHIARLKGRAIDLKRPARKSELLRAGLQVLERLDDAALLATLNALQPIKTGRPKKRH